MGGTVREWLQRPLIEKAATLRHKYWAAKSFLYYRNQFRSFGAGSVILNPMLIGNPQFIGIGDSTLIRDGIRLQAVRDPYGREPLLSIGSNTHIEQNVHIVCHNRLSIGSNVAIAAACAIVDVTHPFRDVHSNVNIAERIADENSYVEIADGAFLGYGTVVLPNVRIGRGAVIGANSVVTKDVPDFGVAAGAPAKVLEIFDREKDAWTKP